MDQLIQQALEVARAMWRRRWVGVLVAWVVGILGAVALTSIPNRYEAGARVYVDTKTVLRPLMNGLAVEPDMDQTISLLARTLINRPNVELLMQKSHLDVQDESPPAHERMVDSLMREIKVAGSGRDNIFNFTYRDSDPDRARLIVQNLVSLFLESDTGTKRQDAEAARGFIDEQIKNYEARLSEAENRLKDFKLRNIGVADSTGKDYFSRMAALSEELGKASVELRAAEQSRDALRRELSGETISLLPDVLPTGSASVASEYDARLDTQRKLLDDLLRRYTDIHPDVISTKRLIARLEEQRQADVDAKRREMESKPVRPSTAVNPVMQQVKLALAEAEASVAALRVRVGDMQSRLGQLRASQSKVPQLEAEMTQLNRDYEVIRGTYQTMVSRREKAALSENVDATRSAQFRVIDPPRTVPQPVSPNRIVLAPLVFLLALAAGAAATLMVVQLLPTFDNSRQLGTLTQRPVLGSVSMLINDAMMQRARRDLFGFGSALGGFVVLAGFWIAWVSMQVRG